MFLFNKNILHSRIAFRLYFHVNCYFLNSLILVYFSLSFFQQVMTTVFILFVTSFSNRESSKGVSYWELVMVTGAAIDNLDSSNSGSSTSTVLPGMPAIANAPTCASVSKLQLRSNHVRLPFKNVPDKVMHIQEYTRKYCTYKIGGIKLIEANAMIQMQKYVYQMSDVKVIIHEDHNIHIVLFFPQEK